MKALPDIIVQGYEPGAVILLSQPDACRAMFEVSVTTSRSALKHYPQSNLQIPDDCEYTLIIAQKRLVEAIMAVRGGKLLHWLLTPQGPSQWQLPSWHCRDL